MNKISRPSKRLAIFFKALFYLYPVAILILWMLMEINASNTILSIDFFYETLENAEYQDVAMWQRLACFAVSMLPGAAVMYVYRALSQLFSLYSREIIFDMKNVACYKAVAWGLIWTQVLRIPEQALQTILLSMNNPEGERFVSIGINDTNITALVVGFMILIVSHIMDEGRKISEEQSLTV